MSRCIDAFDRPEGVPLIRHVASSTRLAVTIRASGLARRATIRSCHDPAKNNSSLSTWTTVACCSPSQRFPASTLAKLGGPLGRAAQRFMTQRYLHALDCL